MKLSCVILPLYPWKQARDIWQRAEQLGLHAAYTYDHLAFEGFKDRPWDGALPTLAAAAAVTENIRLGTMVTSPNFRHPVLLAKELISLDNISDGRVTVGIGAGSSGPDATALGQEPWSPTERADRFADYITLLDRLLTQDATTAQGLFYSAGDARNIGGCVQKPRVPFTVAGSGPRGMRLAATYGQSWVTCPFLDDTHTADEIWPLLDKQIHNLLRVCSEQGRDPSTLDKAYLTGFTPGNPLSQVERFADSGIDELILHWPIPGTAFDYDMSAFERVCARAQAS